MHGHTNYFGREFLPVCYSKHVEIIKKNIYIYIHFFIQYTNVMTDVEALLHDVDILKWFVKVQWFWLKLWLSPK